MSRPRIRTIKPEFFADEKVGSLPIPARYLCLGLITRADDRGRQRLQEKAIAAHVFPAGDVSTLRVAHMLKLVLDTGLASAYQIGAHFYLWLPHFWKHQRINRPSESDLPAHPDDPFGSMSIGDALLAFRESVVRAHTPFTEDSPTAHPSRARTRPLSSLPTKEGIQGEGSFTRELVEEACSILGAVERWQVDAVGIENAAATEPDGDLIRACHLAASWGSDPGWQMGPAASVRSALRKLHAEKPKVDEKDARRKRGADALRTLREVTA